MHLGHYVLAALLFLSGAPAIAAPNGELDLKVSLNLTVSANALTLTHKETDTKKAAGASGAAAAPGHSGTTGDSDNIVGVLDEKLVKPLAGLGEEERPPPKPAPATPNAAALKPPPPPLAKGETAESTATVGLTAKPDIAAGGHGVSVNAQAGKPAITVEKFPDESDTVYQARLRAFTTKVDEAVTAMVRALDATQIVFSTAEEQALMNRKSIQREIPVAFFEDNKQKLVITVASTGIKIDGKLGS